MSGQKHKTFGSLGCDIQVRNLVELSASAGVAPVAPVARTVVSCQPSLTLASPLHAFVLSPALALIVSESRRWTPLSLERHTLQEITAVAIWRRRRVPPCRNADTPYCFVALLKGITRSFFVKKMLMLSVHG